MAGAQGHENYLDRLPDELLLEIIEQQCLSVCDLVSLACTSRRHYRVTISAAYKAHAERQFGIAIYWAIQNGQHGTVQRLVENGVDVNMIRNSDDFDDICFGYDFPDASELTEKKAWMELDNHDYQGLPEISPLAFAAIHGEDSMVELLLDYDADIELQSADMCGCSRVLFRCWADLPSPPELFPDDFCSGTPLHYAICNRHPSTAQLLLERGASVDNVGGGITALQLATYWEMDEMIDYLMDQGLDHIAADNQDGATALHVAHARARDDLVDRFLDRGADINAEYFDKTGPWTIFSMAVAEGLFIRALHYLERGADPHFVLQGPEEAGLPWTVMRLIWHELSDDCSGEEQFNARIRLERAIIAGGRPDLKMPEDDLGASNLVEPE